jgi:hypothetical protein
MQLTISLRLPFTRDKLNSKLNEKQQFAGKSKVIWWILDIKGLWQFSLRLWKFIIIYVKRLSSNWFRVVKNNILTPSYSQFDAIRTDFLVIHRIFKTTTFIHSFMAKF